MFTKKISSFSRSPLLSLTHLLLRDIRQMRRPRGPGDPVTTKLPITVVTSFFSFPPEPHRTDISPEEWSESGRGSGASRSEHKSTSLLHRDPSQTPSLEGLYPVGPKKSPGFGGVYPTGRVGARKSLLIPRHSVQSWYG